jgi:DNA-binding NtrC family response regulator
MSRPTRISPETILVVNDIAGVLSSTSSILTDAGFNVLSASTPEAAIEISLDFAGPIDLLLSGVMMPGMSGPDLADKLMEQRPKLRVMLMTGYNNGNLLVLNYGWYLVPRQSLAKVLREKVNAVLHSANRSQGTDKFDTSK